MAARFWVGGAGTWNNVNTANWSATSGGAGGASAPTAADDVTFNALSGTGIVTTAATAAANSVVYNSSTLTRLTLGAAFTINASTSGAFTLTLGTLNLNNFTLTSKTFASSNSNVRAIQFGTGNITVTGSGTIWTTLTATNLSYTGTPTVNISNNTATSIDSIGVAAHDAGGTESNAFNFNITTGTYALEIDAGSHVKSLNFTGFAGYLSTDPSSDALYIYGNLTWSSSMVVTTALDLYLSATSGTQVINFAGLILGLDAGYLPTNIIQATASPAVVQFAAGTHTIRGTYSFDGGASGTLDLGTNNATLACDGFSTSDSVANRTFAFGSSGSISVALTYSIEAGANPPTFTGTSTIKGGGNALSFTGGGPTYNNLNISGSAVTVVGATTFTTITATTQGTLTLPASTTTTVGSFNISAPVTLLSSTSGTQATLSLSTAAALSYLNVRDINVSSANLSATYGRLYGNASGFNITGITFTNQINKYITLTSGTSWTVPADWNNLDNQIILIGGGGGGAGNNATVNNTGGAGGGCCVRTNVTLTPSSSVPYAIGAAGTAGTSGGGNGGTGGTTTLNNTITFVSSAVSVQNTASTTITVTVPSVSNGNLMVMVLNSASATNTWTTPAGWTLGTAGANGRALFWRVASSEPASYTVTQSTSTTADAVIMAYANAVFDKSNLAAQTAASPITPATIVVAANNSTLIYAAANNASASATFTTPTGYTARASDSDATAPSAAIFDIANIAAITYTAPSTTTSTGTARAFLIAMSPSAILQATGGAGGQHATNTTLRSGGTGSGGTLNYSGGSIPAKTGGTSGGWGTGAAGPFGNGVSLGSVAQEGSYAGNYYGGSLPVSLLGAYGPVSGTEINGLEGSGYGGPSTSTGTGGLYGGGGGSAASNATAAGFAGAQGAIFINYTPTTATQRTRIITSGSTFTVPSDFVSLISVECIGAGGGAYTVASANVALGGGAGGGAYSASTSVTGLTPGGTAYISIGTRGTNSATPTAGGDTWFNAASAAAPTLTSQGALAKGGGAATSSVGGTGGATASGVGTIKSSGGNGGIPVSGLYAFTGGAGGGSGGGNGTTTAYNGGNGGSGAVLLDLLASSGGGGGAGGPNSSSGGAGSVVPASLGGIFGGIGGLGPAGGDGGIGLSLAAFPGGGGGGVGGGADNSSGALISLSGNGAGYNQYYSNLGVLGPGGGGGGGANDSGFGNPGGGGGPVGGGAGSGSTQLATSYLFNSLSGNGVIVFTYSTVASTGNFFFLFM